VDLAGNRLADHLPSNITDEHFYIPPKFILQIVGEYRIGKSSFVNAINRSLKDLEDDWQIAEVASDNRETISKRSKLYSIGDNLLVHDHGGVVVFQDSTIQLQFIKKKICKSAYIAESSAGAASLRLTIVPDSFQLLARIRFPTQLVVLCVPALVFCPTTEPDVAEKRTSHKVFLNDLLRVLRQPRDDSGLHRTAAPILLITQADQTEYLAEESVIRNAQKALGVVRSNIFMITNYHDNDGRQGRRDYSLEETVLSLLKRAFSSITGMLGDFCIPKELLEKLEIVKAVYAKEDDTSSYVDVTARVRELIDEKERLHINPHAYNKVVVSKDPYRGKNKVLIVDYRYKGMRKRVQVREREALDLPE